MPQTAHINFQGVLDNNHRFHVAVTILLEGYLICVHHLS